MIARPFGMPVHDSTNNELEGLRSRVAELEGRLQHSAEVERQLAEYKERWQSIVENSSDVILLIDRQGVIEFISRPDRTPEEVLGTVGIDYLVADHRQMMQAAIASVFERGRPVVKEVQEEERGRWYSIRVAPLRQDGEIESVVAICTEITERRAKEEELYEKEARLRLLLKQLPAIVWTTDAALRFTSSNGAGLARLGLKPGEVVGRTVYEYMGTEDVNFRPIQAMLGALKGRSQAFDLEFQGNIYQVLVEPLRDAQGRVEGTLGVALDVTEGKQVERSLAESEERFRQMAEHIRDVFYLSDPQEGKLLYISPAYEELWGRPRDELWEDFRAWTSAIHPEDRERVIDNLQKLHAGQGRRVMQFRVVRPDGDTRWVEDRCFPVQSEGGLRIAGVCADITERKLAEERLLSARDDLERRVAERTRDLRASNRMLREDIAERERISAELRESESRFRVLAEESPVPVSISNLEDGEILYCNARLAALLGVPEDRLVGRHMTEFYDDPADRSNLLTTLQREGSVRDEELQLRRADGGQLWVSVSMCGILYGGEQRLYAGLVDITRTKDTEESLRAERRLLKRLLELHERDRQLVAYEIHDGMVQDLTGAKMFIESVQHALSDRPKQCDQLAHALKLLRDSIDEARRMINGLRPPILEDQGLVAAIENLVDEISNTAGLEVELQHDVQFGRIAPALEMAVYRIVHEGLNNVWQHSGSKRARVEMVQHGDEVRISVQDWGCGFDPTKVSNRRYGLRGIRERARLLGGRAQVSSSPELGTRIDVMLPLTDVLLPAEAGESELKSPAV